MAIGEDKDSQKKQIGELLKAADRHIKSAEWNKALDEVGKALAIEPNNMYAKAYKDRIDVSINEGKKKVEEEKVKKLAEENKKTPETPVEVKEEKKSEPEKPAESPKEEKKEEKKEDPSKAEAKASPAAATKDDSSTRIDSLRQEFAATQAKLQREVAQLTMQVKEAQALKDAVEKNLNAQLVSLTQELTAAKQNSGKGDGKESDALKKELESFKAKQQKEIETAKEVAKAEMLTQIAVLQKELEAAKIASEGASLKKQGEQILKNMFNKAWQDGSISGDERALLLLLKEAIEMSDSKFGEMETGTKSDAYINALRAVWSDGLVRPEESDFLTSLREKLGIPAEEHFKLESQIRKEVKK